MIETLVIPLSTPHPLKAWRLSLLHSCPRDRYFWITRGQARALVGGRTIALGQNTLLFVPAGQLCRFTLGTASFALLVETEFAAQDSKADFVRVGDLATQRDVLGIIESIRDETDQPKLGFQRAAKAHVLLLEVWMSRALAERPLPQKPKAAERVALSYLATVEAEYTSAWTPQNYADHLKITPTHLTRATRTALGDAASKLLTERKMHSAMSLLADTRVPVSQIAQSLGFSSAGYFTRSFQAFNSQSPSDFRKQALLAR